MSPEPENQGLQLNDEEANALLAMCLTSPHKLDGIAESALRKLAHYCIQTSNHKEHIEIELFDRSAGNE